MRRPNVSFQRESSAAIAPALAIILLIGAGLRIFRIEFHSLWSDELTTWYEVWRPNFADFWQHFTGLELTPPLFFGLEFLVSRFTEASEWSVRALSCASGIGLIFALYLFGQELAGKWCGVIAAAFGCTSYRAIMFSQEARSYSLLFLLTALSGWAWLKIVNRSFSPRIRDRVLYIAIGAALSYTHYFGVLMILSQALSTLILMPVSVSRRERIRFVLSWLLTYVAIGIAYLPWLWFLHAHPLPQTALHRAVPWTELFVAHRELFGSSAVNALLSLLLCLAAVFWTPLKRRNLAVLTWIFVPFFLAMFITSHFKPIYGLRNYMVVLAPALALSAAGATALRRWWTGLAIITAVAFTIMGLHETIFARKFYTEPRSDQVREAIAESLPFLSAHPQAQYIMVGLVPYQPQIYLDRFHAPNFNAIFDTPDFVKTEKWSAELKAADEILVLFFADDIHLCDSALQTLSDRYQVLSRTELRHVSTVLLRRL